jgi:hypothetical protein
VSNTDGAIGDRPPHGSEGGPQKPRNEAWPLLDGARRHAEGIRDQPNPIPATVRVDFPADGEEWLEGMATRWTRTHVYVVVADPRLAVLGLWVLATDVRRQLANP